MMERPGWGTAASLFNWIAGIITVLNGFGIIIAAATAMDMLNQLSVLLDNTTGLGSISMAIPILLGILALIVGALGIACGYGLWAMRNWARISAAILHGVFALLYLIGMIMLISMNLVGASILLLFFFGINVMFLVGLLLHGTAEAYTDGGMGIGGETRIATGASYGGMGGYMPPTQSDTQAMGSMGGTAGGGRLPPTETATAASRMTGGKSYAQPGSAGRGIKKTEVANAEPPVLAWIIERNGIRKGREHRLRSEGVTIGRDPNHCEIVIDEAKVSARHAHIKLENGHFVIYDLASTNRTFVNEKETQKHVLRDNDQIKIGPNVLLSFVHVKR